MSASPAPEATQQQRSGKIAFRFCRECANMLYPRENKDTDRLEFACRTCAWKEEATSSCVFRNELANTVGETAGITQDVGQDPTLPRIRKECGKCHADEAVFFQSQQRTAETGMKLYYVCTHCGNVWQ